MDHLLVPGLPGKDVQAVLALLGHLDVHQQELLILDPVPGIPLLTPTLEQSKSTINMGPTKKYAHT